VTSTTEMYDKYIETAQAERQCASERQAQLRFQAREKGLPTKVKDLARMVGPGEFKCLKLESNTSTTWLHYGGKEVFRIVWNNNIQVYCTGPWETILDQWHREANSELARKRGKLRSVRQSTATIEANFCSPCS